MRPETLQTIQLKPKEEIIDQLKEIIRRHRRRFLKKYLRACPNNCSLATLKGNHVTGCNACGSRNPEHCLQEQLYVPHSTKEDLAEEFSERLRDTYVLQHEYRDIMVFLWVLGQLDQSSVPNEVIADLEARKGKT